MGKVEKTLVWHIHELKVVRDNNIIKKQYNPELEIQCDVIIGYCETYLEKYRGLLTKWRALRDDTF